MHTRRLGWIYSIRPIMIITFLWLLCLASSVWAAPNPYHSTLTSQEQNKVKGVVLKVGVASRLGQDLWFKAAHEEEGLPYKIQWINFVAAPPAMDALLANSIDTFMGGDTPAVFLAKNNGSAKVVSASKKGLFGAVLVKQNSPIQTVEQLRGKKIGVYRGSGFHNSLLSILKDHAISPSDVKWVYLDPSDGLTALINGDIDAWGVWDPNAAIVQIQYGARILATPKVFSLGLQFASNHALEDPAKALALQDFLARSFDANHWVRSHPQEWSRIEQQQAHIGKGAADLSSSRFGGQFLPLAGSTEEYVQSIADSFHKAGILNTSVNVKAVFDNRYDDILSKLNKE